LTEGIEAGCRLIVSNGVLYHVIWRSGTLVAGQEVEVEGTLRAGLASTCQQGTTLVVERDLSPKRRPAP